MKKKEEQSLFSELLAVEDTKHSTTLSHLKHGELWDIGDTPLVWDDPVEALKEVITRECVRKEQEGESFYYYELDYLISVFILQVIIKNGKFKGMFSAEDIADAREMYKHNSYKFFTNLPDDAAL